MLDVFGFPTPQGANYQEFYGGGTVRDWVKPRGASMVRMLLIGAGGGGGGGNTTGAGGGGSGAVTQWIGPAIFIPDVLQVSIGLGGAGGAAVTDGSSGAASTIVFQQKNGAGYSLLSASGGVGGKLDGSAGSGGSVSGNNNFGAAGIFKSVTGQSGASSGTPTVSASTTTFLCGGAAAYSTGGGDIDSKYGYPALKGGTTDSTPLKGADGYFLTTPIMVGFGGAGGGYSTTSTGGIGGNGGIGCGGGAGGRGNTAGGAGGRGGDGAVFIWSW